MVLQLRVQLEEEDAHLEEDDGAGVEEQVPDPHHHLDVQAADRGGGGEQRTQLFNCHHNQIHLLFPFLKLIYAKFLFISRFSPIASENMVRFFRVSSWGTRA